MLTNQLKMGKPSTLGVSSNDFIFSGSRGSELRSVFSYTIFSSIIEEGFVPVLWSKLLMCAITPATNRIVADLISP